MGYRHFVLLDTKRPDPWYSGRLRKIRVTVFYPSDAPKLSEPYGTEETAFWHDALQGPVESREITPGKRNRIVQSLASLRVCKTGKASPARSGHFPVILFCHGFDVTSGSYQSVVLELASHGFVVLVPAFTGIASRVLWPDGSEDTLKASRDALAFQTAFQDSCFVLNNMARLVSFIVRASPEQTGVLGHSLGASVAVRLARSSPFVCAGIALDPPVSHRVFEYENDIPVPCTLDSQIPLDQGSGLARPFLHMFAENFICDPDDIVPGAKTSVIIIKNTDHNAFADHLFLKDIPEFRSMGWSLGAGKAASLPAGKKIRQTVRTFFEKNLKNPVKVSMSQEPSE